MHKSENSNTAEQCLVKPEKKKKWNFLAIFWSTFQTVRFFVNLFALVDKYGPKVTAFLKEFFE